MDLGIYARDGRPIEVEEFDRLLGDRDYRRVALTDVGPYTVSTVWLGVDHGWGLTGTPPVIFETMVFTASAWHEEGGGVGPDLDMCRYCTEGEARAGHEAMVTLIRATVLEAEDVLPEDHQTGP